MSCNALWDLEKALPRIAERGTGKLIMLNYACFWSVEKPYKRELLTVRAEHFDRLSTGLSK